MAKNYQNYRHLLNLLINWNVNYAPIVNVKYGYQLKAWPTKLWFIPVADNRRNISIYAMCLKDAHANTTQTQPIVIKLVDYMINHDTLKFDAQFNSSGVDELRQLIGKSVNRLNSKTDFKIIATSANDFIKMVKSKLLEIDTIVNTFQASNPTQRLATAPAPKNRQPMNVFVYVDVPYGELRIKLTLNNPENIKLTWNDDPKIAKDPIAISLDQWLIEHVLPNNSNLLYKRRNLKSPLPANELDDYLKLPENQHDFGVYTSTPISWLSHRAQSNMIRHNRIKTKLATEKQINYAQSVIDNLYDPYQWIDMETLESVRLASQNPLKHTVKVHKIQPLFEKDSQKIGITIKQADFIMTLDPSYKEKQDIFLKMTKHDAAQLIKKLLDQQSQSSKGPDSNG